MRDMREKTFFIKCMRDVLYYLSLNRSKKKKIPIKNKIKEIEIHLKY